ncbi:hypothetical protein M9H77_08820 [Catharanthus roseus]|uniref:Uncharacterized protein n=1 Tax=Catharanthus roseus TaxID=4058 RepID=A0ACC0BYX4_CATRO|nr:hypothetical protein M9H77_08820 [Catharanthus roseus]
MGKTKPSESRQMISEKVVEEDVSKGLENVNREHDHSAINVYFPNGRCEINCLNVQGKIVFVDEKDVESMLGIKSGTMDIIEALVKGNIDSALERELGLEIEHPIIALPKVRKRLIVMDSYGKEFIMKYVLFIVGQFLSPLMKYSVRRSMLKLLSNIERRELNWSKFFLVSVVISVRKQNKENKASFIGCVYILGMLYMGHFYPVREKMLPKMSRNLTRVLNWDKNSVLSWGIHKRLNLSDQNMKQLRGGLEGVREEVACMGRSVEAANRSVMEVVMNVMIMLKKGQEDQLRNIREDIRKEEGRIQINSYIRCENKDRFGSGNSTKWNEEDEQFGDVNDELGVEEKDTPNEENVGINNEYNDMKIDNDGFSDENDKLSEGEIVRFSKGFLLVPSTSSEQGDAVHPFRWGSHITDIVSRIKRHIIPIFKSWWIGRGGEVYITRSNESWTKKITQAVHRFIRY